MDLDEFLERHVEGYLFCDLKKMCEITLSEREQYGAAGYPILSSITAGMELLGWLADETEEDFNENKGSEYFMFFWDNYMAKKPQYILPLGRLVRKLVRNGLAHSFLAKPGVYITKESTGWHLKSAENELIIDAKSLTKDFINIYLTHWKVLLKDQKVKKRVQKKLYSLLDNYEKDSRKAFEKFYADLPDDSTFVTGKNLVSIPTIGSPAASITNFSSLASGMRSGFSGPIKPLNLSTPFSASPSNNPKLMKKLEKI